jgi:ABC-2 type transport system permease protein
VLFLSGFSLPIGFYPDWAQPLLLALPFSTMVQVPAEIFVGHLTGAELLMSLARQAMWAVALLCVCQVLIMLALRRVSVQGG